MSYNIGFERIYIIQGVSFTSQKLEILVNLMKMNMSALKLAIAIILLAVGQLADLLNKKNTNVCLEFWNEIRTAPLNFTFLEIIQMSLMKRM